MSRHEKRGRPREWSIMGLEVGQLYTDRWQYVSKLRANSARLTALNRATSKASASRSASSIAALTTFSTAQLETGSSLPIAKMRVPLTARWTSRSDTVLRSAAIVQPPPWPFSDRTYPASRRPAIVRRTTTALVPNMREMASDVIGPSRRAIWSSTWSIRERRLSIRTSRPLMDGLGLASASYHDTYGVT